jgi:hypothetical protein
MNERVKTVESLEVPGPSDVQPHVLFKCQERQVWDTALLVGPKHKTMICHFLVDWLCQHKQPSAGHEPLRQALNGNFMNHFLGCSTVHSILATTQCCHNCSVGTSSV